VKLGIVSSNSEENIRAILGPDQARLIGVFECGASLFRKARRFRKALQRTGIGAGETITVGDEIRDLEAAREAGIAFGAVAWGYTDAEALRALAPAFLFHQPAEIAARLLP
jgi:phosphoglycolate phosphatase